MVIAAAKIDGPVRDGEILSTGPDGDGPYRIRWSDTGTESLFFPGPDAHVQHSEPASTAEPAAQQSDTEPAATDRPRPAHTKSWRIDVYLYEDEHSTSAQAVLHGDAPATLQGRGLARLRPGDPDVPEIGDEVAVARALRRLSDRLLGTAADDLSQVIGRPVSLPG